MDRHVFHQAPDVSVRVCTCGQWPDHHVHTGDTPACGCDHCRSLLPNGYWSSRIPGGDTKDTMPPYPVTYEVRKYAALIPVSDHLLMDSMDVPTSPTPMIKASMRDRVHAWIYSHVRKRIASWIMGYPVDTPCEHEDHDDER